MNRTHLLALLIFLTAACAEVSTTTEKEEENQEQEESTASTQESAYIVIEDLDSALVAPEDSLRDWEEVPREFIATHTGGAYLFQLAADDSKEQRRPVYLVKRFRRVEGYRFEGRPKGDARLSVPFGEDSLRFQLPAGMLQ